VENGAVYEIMWTMVPFMR